MNDKNVKSTSSLRLTIVHTSVLQKRGYKKRGIWAQEQKIQKEQVTNTDMLVSGRYNQKANL